jgi:hypothetical protein
MQYVFNDRRTYITTIEFRNTLPINNIERIRAFTEEGVSGIFIKREFTYSFDNVIWNPWQILTNAALTSINFQDKNDFYLHFKYTRASVVAGNIGSVYLIYDSRKISPLSPIDTSIIDADLLQGEDGQYYLNRTNQFGPFTDLNVYNLSDASSAIGVYANRIDSSLGTDLYFRSILGIDGIKVYESSTGESIVLETSTNIITEYDTSLALSLTMPQTVGGIPAGTTVADLYGDSFTKLFDDLLFPTVYPTYVNPSNTFSFSGSSLYEVSTYFYNPNPNSPIYYFTASFDRGAILLNASFENYRAGTLITYNYYGSNIAGSVIGFERNLDNYYVTQGNQTWSSDVSYNAGPQPYDNKGNVYGTPLPPGKTSLQSFTIEGVYPLFATTSNINTLTKQILVSMLYTSLAPTASGITLVAESGGSKQKFEIPVAWPYTSLTGIQTFNTTSNQWEYELGTAPLSLTRWAVSNVTETIQVNTIAYKRYTYNGPDRSSILIRLVI